MKKNNSVVYGLDETSDTSDPCFTNKFPDPYVNYGTLCSSLFTSCKIKRKIKTILILKKKSNDLKGKVEMFIEA